MRNLGTNLLNGVCELYFSYQTYDQLKLNSCNYFKTVLKLKCFQRNLKIETLHRNNN